MTPTSSSPVAAAAAAAIRVETVVVANEGKAIGGSGGDGDGTSVVPIRTGIGYLDHMIDQLNSHAQVGVGLVVVAVPADGDGRADGDSDDGRKVSEISPNYDHNWLANSNQVELCSVVGKALGEALYRDILSKVATTGDVSRFCCPLDEALVECIICPMYNPISGGDCEGKLKTYDVPPYGIYPRGGRTHIGSLETFAIESFWKSLAESSKLNLSFTKIRGDNAHHIVESSFKAFSRALRKHLDSPDIWNINGTNHQATVALARVGEVERSTKETSISVRLCLDVSPDDLEKGLRSDDTTDSSTTTTRTTSTHVDTGIPVLDVFYETLAREAHMSLQIKCDGDRWVDDHHTAEDVSIAVGQCLVQALGTKAGLNRMWVADATTSDVATTASPSSTSSSSSVEVTMDLSNRPCLAHNLHATLSWQEYVDVDVVGGAGSESDGATTKLTCEMFEHCLDSLVMNGRMTVHIVEKQPRTAADSSSSSSSSTSMSPSVFDVAICTAKAFGKALRVCSMIDPRRAGKTASSKGTLSV